MGILLALTLGLGGVPDGSLLCSAGPAEMRGNRSGLSAHGSARRPV